MAISAYAKAVYRHCAIVTVDRFSLKNAALAMGRFRYGTPEGERCSNVNGRPRANNPHLKLGAIGRDQRRAVLRGALVDGRAGGVADVHPRVQAAAQGRVQVSVKGGQRLDFSLAADK